MKRYSKLKANDLKEKPRNNYSVINNNYKISEKAETSDENSRKNLTVSHEFHNRYSNKLGQNHQPDRDQWTSTITGLFDDNKSIKCMKESIKFRGKTEEVYEK